MKGNQWRGRKTYQPRCADCGKILDYRTIKPKGQPRRCGVCQTQAEMQIHFEVTPCLSRSAG
jgi:hypothetical protein